jgi:hypothetical protein
MWVQTHEIVRFELQDQRGLDRVEHGLRRGLCRLDRGFLEVVSGKRGQERIPESGSNFCVWIPEVSLENTVLHGVLEH